MWGLVPILGGGGRSSRPDICWACGAASEALHGSGRGRPSAGCVPSEAGRVERPVGLMQGP